VSPAHEPVAADLPPGPGPRPLTVTGLLLLDPHGHDPTAVESITFDDGGIGVVRSRGEAPRVLPWAALVAHAVEPWAGGVIPGWWVEPDTSGADVVATDTSGANAVGTDTSGANAVGTDAEGVDAVEALLAGSRTATRRLPHADAGAMISIQTRSGTYRFLRSGGDPTELAPRIAEFAVRHRGPAGVSTVTTVAARRRGPRSGWARVRPWLVALLVVVLAAVVTVILLQSAGVVHLHFLGGDASSGAGALDRSPPT